MGGILWILNINPFVVGEFLEEDHNKPNESVTILFEEQPQLNMSLMRSLLQGWGYDAKMLLSN